MKHTIKKFTAVFLALSLLAGMMTLFSTSVSAASDLTISVTSNLPDVFPASTIQVESGTKMVKVTYHINTPKYRIINCEWLLEYDSTKLTPELKTGGYNVDLNESGQITSYRFMQFANNVDGQIINTNPVSYRNREDGVRAILGNATDPKGFATAVDTVRDFVTVYFLINDNATGTAEVNLKLKTLQVCPKTSAGDKVHGAADTIFLVKKELLQREEVPNINTILPQLNAENKEQYLSEAEVEDEPIRTGYSLWLKDSIKLKVIVFNVTKEKAEDYSVEVTYKGTTRTSETDKTLKLKAKPQNELLLANTHAPDMVEKAHLVIRDSNNAIIVSRYYSVQGYCEKQILSPTSSESLRNLCRAVLNYGAEAQLFFGRNTNNLANSNTDLRCALIQPYPAVPDTYKLTKEIENFDYSLGLGYTLTLDSETQLDLFFSLSQGESWDQFTISVQPSAGYYSVSTTEKGEKYVRIYGINTRNLANEAVIEVKGPNNGTKTYHISALSYAYKTQNSSEGQGDVVKALYAFYLATIEYQQNP